jgi:hypothetical protein
MPARMLALGDPLVVTAIHARTPCGTDADGCRNCICRFDVPIQGLRLPILCKKVKQKWAFWNGSIGARASHVVVLAEECRVTSD